MHDYRNPGVCWAGHRLKLLYCYSLVTLFFSGSDCMFGENYAHRGTHDCWSNIGLMAPKNRL